eukprot:5792107-Prymnesium_polylepis.1
MLIVAAARRREVLGGRHPAARRGSAIWRPPRSHASPGYGAPRGRHGVGTEHTRGAKAGRSAMVRAASRAACDGAGSEPATGHAR